MERNLKNIKKICSKKNDSTVGEHSTHDNSTSEILNDDCLLHIFEYLPISDRIRLERVNKRWCAVSRMSWKSFRTLNFTSSLWGKIAAINRKAIKDVLSRCGQFLKVWDMSKISVNRSEEIHVQSLLKFCPNLISVDLSSIKVGVTLIRSLLKSCKNIVILNLGKITVSVPDWFRNGTILSTYTKLQVLNIESENVNYCPVADVSFSGDWMKLMNKDSMKELHLDYCRGLDKSNIFSVVPQLSNLHTLSLRGSLEDWNVPWDIYFVTKSNVKVLDISSNSLCVDDNFLVKIACVCERLTSLYIGANSKVTDKGLSAALSSSNLEYLNIDELNINGTSLSDLPYLKRLSCRYCEHLQYKSFENLFTSERLEVIDLKHVNAGGIIASAIKSIKSWKNNVTLHMIVDAFYVKTDVPDNLKLSNQDDENK